MDQMIHPFANRINVLGFGKAGATIGTMYSLDGQEFGIPMDGMRLIVAACSMSKDDVVRRGQLIDVLVRKMPGFTREQVQLFCKFVDYGTAEGQRMLQQEREGAAS